MKHLQNHITRLSSFLRDESGAITIDWVVLTASIVMLGAVIGITVLGNVPELAGDISDTISTTTTIAY